MLPSIKFLVLATNQIAKLTQFILIYMWILTTNIMSLFSTTLQAHLGDMVV